MRRAGGQPQQPGQQVPHDRADQPGEDHRRGYLRLVHEPAGDGLRDLDREERAAEVEDAEISTAVRGFSTPVATKVATALAVS